MELLISNHVEEYMKENIEYLLDYDQEDLTNEITNYLVPNQGFLHLDKLMYDEDLYGLECSCDADACYIDTPLGSLRTTTYTEFEELKERYK
jgi:hypothetical protein